MRVKGLKRWDAAEHLDTPEAQAEYLSLVMADGDAEEILDALNVVARGAAQADDATTSEGEPE